MALGNESCKYLAKPKFRLTPFSVCFTCIARLVCERWASSEIQIIFALFDKRRVSSVNLWMVVRNTPPLVRPVRYSRSLSLLSTSITHSSPIKFLAVPNNLESWSSKSVRSVIRTIVGLANSRLRISILLRNSMVMLFPHPVAPK